ERLRHDDPRLDNLQASYSMIEKQQEDLGFTRRNSAAEKGRPKQEPVIKGVFPDQPAPVAPARPEVVVAPVVAAPLAAATASTVASSGFFGWIKRVLGLEAQPARPLAPATVEED